MKISIILKILGLSIALAIISFFILNYLARSRLNRIVNPTFDITKVVAIERASISEHSEVYNDDRFIEYECVYKDSCLDLVNLGRVDSLFHHVEDIVEVTNTPIPFPNSFFPYLIAAEPYSVSIQITSFYNVYSMPYSSLNKVKLYIKGQINNSPEVGLSYNIGIDNNRTDAELVFNLHNGKLYVVVLTKALDVNNLLKKYLP